MHRRRNRDADLIDLAAPWAGLAVLATLMVPSIRQFLLVPGLIALCLFALWILVLSGFRMYGPSRTSKPEIDDSDWATAPVTLAVTSPVTALTPPESDAALIKQLRSVDWFQFEKLVALLYRKLGYSVTHRGGANPDGGIDLVIAMDGRQTAVQCKQWKTWNVGVKAVREFLGALKDAGIEAGIFITLRGYTGDAKSLAEKHGIEIVNQTGLAKMLEATNARFDPETLAILNDDEKYCPKCESKMVLRTATKGRNTGRKFWGCSKYPQCRFILDA